MTTLFGRPYIRRPWMPSEKIASPTDPPRTLWTQGTMQEIHPLEFSPSEHDHLVHPCLGFGSFDVRLRIIIHTLTISSNGCATAIRTG